MEFDSLNGKKFIKFSKSKKLVIPFYDNIVEPYLKTGLIVETWGHARDANCSRSFYY